MNILFVCTGNTCRSPMCEWFFRDLCSKNKCLDKINIKSAGTGALNGCPISKYSLAALKKNNIEADSHRSQELNPELLEWADLVVAMTNSHIAAINSLSKNLSKPPMVKLLSEFSNGNNPISDPFGGQETIYEKCFLEMKSHLCNLYDIIKKDLKSN